MRTSYISFLTALVLYASAAVAQDGAWLRYDPEVVTLRGKVTTIVKYGAPGYGESPEIDDLEIPIILVLPLPVRVAETMTNITHIQLVFHTSQFPDYRTYIGKEASIKGKLFEAVTGHHFTPVLLEVEAVKIISTANSTPQRSEERFLAQRAKPAKKGMPKGSLPRKPEIAQLEGDLTKVIKYGAPNYGDPETDEKLDVPLLMLLSPVDVEMVEDNVAYVNLSFQKTFVISSISIEACVSPGRYLNRPKSVTLSTLSWK